MLLLSSFLLPTASAVDNGSYGASGVQASGELALVGSEAILKLDLSLQSSGQASFSIDSQSAVLDRLVRDRTGGGNDPLVRETSWVRIHEGPIEIGTSQLDSNAMLFVGSTGPNELTATANFVALGASRTENVRELDVVKFEPEIREFNVSESVEILDFPGAQEITLLAPLNLTVWNWDGVGKTPNGPIQLVSRAEDEGVDASRPPAVLADGAQQLFIRLQEGSVTISLDSGVVSDFFIKNLALDVQGSVELLEAHLLGTDDSENLEGNGRFDLRVPRTVSDSLEVLILGQDTPLAPSEPGSPGPSSIVAPDVSPGQDNQLAILALSGALIAAIAGFSWMAVKQRREGLMKALRDAMEFGLYDIVLAKAPRLVKGQYASEASLMTFVAGMHEEGTQATRTKLATSSALTKALDPAAKEFLHACIDAHEGNDVDAQSHLEACIELDASFQDEANNNPFLADVLQRILSKQRPADGYEFS